MATIITSCPQCKKQIKVPDELVGKKIKCKGCDTAFVVTATAVQPGAKPPAAAASTLKPYDDDFGDGKPYGVTDLDLAPRCPHCANELEDADQVICLICGFNNETRQKAERRRIKDASGMDNFLWLLPGILAALLFFVSPLIYFFLALLTIGMCFWSIGDFVSDNPPMLKSMVFCPWLWSIVLCLFTMYWSAKYAIKRLFINNKPPEEELH